MGLIEFDKIMHANSTYYTLVFQLMDWIELILMQDGVRCHWSHFTRAMLDRWEINCTDHPPYSPDLNPIENVWSWMRDYISHRYSEQEIPLDRLKPVIEDTCHTVPEYMLENLARSMPQRVQQVIEREGAATDYERVRLLCYYGVHVPR